MLQLKLKSNMPFIIECCKDFLISQFKNVKLYLFIFFSCRFLGFFLKSFLLILVSFYGIFQLIFYFCYVIQFENVSTVWKEFVGTEEFGLKYFVMGSTNEKQKKFPAINVNEQLYNSILDKNMKEFDNVKEFLPFEIYSSNQQLKEVMEKIGKIEEEAYAIL